MTATQTAAPKKASKATAKKPTSAQVDNVDLDAEAAAEAELQAAEAAKRDEMKHQIAAEIGDALADLASADKDNAVQARALWANVGRKLIEGETLFTTGNGNVDNKGYGAWIDANGFKALGQRPTRAAAVWLARVADFKPDLYALFPTESENGEPLARAPRTLQAWVRSHIYEAFQNAHKADRDMEIATDAEDKETAKIAAEAAPAKVYAVLLEELDAAQEMLAQADKAVKSAKGKEARTAAMAQYESAAAVLDAVNLRRAILDNHSSDEVADLFVRWKPKPETVAFKDMPVPDAAAKVFGLLKLHPEFSAVYTAIAAMVDALQAKIDADAGEVSEDDEPDVGEGDEGFDEDADAADLSDDDDDGIEESSIEDDAEAFDEAADEAFDDEDEDEE